MPIATHRLRGRRRPVGVIAACALACGPVETAKPVAPTATSNAPASALIRLVEQLDGARVQSAFDGVVPARELDSLDGAVERRERLATRFEAGSVPLSGACDLAPGALGPAGRGRVVRCDDGGALALPAEPGRLYALRAELRAAGDTGCETQSVQLVERRQGEPITLRPFAEVGTGQWSWQRAVYRTRPETHRVDLSFLAGPCRGYLREVVLEEIRLTPAQELAWLAGHGTSPDASPLRRRGRLLPLPDPETADAPHDDAYTVRDALFAPAPSRIVFDVDVPARSRLHVSYGLSSESQPGDAADLSIEVEADGETRSLLQDRIDLTDPAAWHWRHASLDLSGWAGRRVSLAFRAQALRGRGYALWGSPRIVRERRPEDPPNVVLVAIDTLRADRLSSYGHAKATSPHLDAFARDALRFERAISAANWTSPAFHALFTGASADGVGASLPAHRRTLAERLGEAGFLTRAIAYKPVLYDHGFDQGFDDYFNVPRTHVRAEDALARALRFLDEHARERFFLFLHLDDPHQPFTQPESHLSAADRGRLRELGLSLPITVKSERIEGCDACSDADGVNDASRALAHALYDDAIRYADGALGALLDRLRALGLYEDAVIVVVSDHGEGLWQHEAHFGHAGPSLYDEVVRIPLLLKPPGAPEGTGRAVSPQVRLGDLFPTLLELAGVEVPAGGPARSLLTASQEGDRDALIRGEGSVALRTPAWKYVRRAPRDAGRVEEQLFDLVADPGERRDVVARQGEARTGMRRALAQMLWSSGERPAVQILGRSRARRLRVVLEVQDGRWLPELSSLPWQVSPGAGRIEWSGEPGDALPAGVQLHATSASVVHVQIWEDDRPALSRRLASADAEPFSDAEDAGNASAGPLRVRLRAAAVPVATPDAADAQVIDARALEALRNLGYVEP